jgi:D-xylose transport system substrate-binding protein
LKVIKLPRIALALGVIAVSALTIVGMTSASTKTARHATAGAQVCVLLPDSKSSVRWETQDRPRLQAAFKNLGDTVSIVNAEGSASTQLSQAQQCLTNGAKVLLLVNLDSGSGAQIEKLAGQNKAQVVDYDRLTLGGTAAVYVSFNNVTVGKLQGQGLVNCLKSSGEYGKRPVVAELNGSPTDNNATLFAQGYNSVLNPLYASGRFVKGPNQSVPQWDNQQALTIFQGMLTKTSNKINAVLSANDGLGNAAISALKSAGLTPIPVTGQDATAQGVQNIISGWQCMTVYKSIQAEASAAATAANDLLRGKKVPTNGTTDNGPRNVPSVLLTPISITKKNWQVLVSSGFLKKSDVCTGAYKQYC